MTPALIKMARITLHRALPPMELPAELASLLEQIVRETPHHADAYRSFAYIAHGMNMQANRPRHINNPRITSSEFTAMRQAYERMTAQSRRAVNILVHDKVFFNLLRQLRHNFLVCVGIADEAGARRMVKLAYERKITAWTENRFTRRFSQGLGWRCWPFTVLIGGTGGSHHLEVAAAPGVDVVEITAVPTDPTPPSETTFWVRGFSPHVHVRVPAAPSSRFRATIRIQTSRLGWASTSAAAVSGIAVVMFTGWLKLHTLTDSADEAGTAAVLLLAVLGGIATWLVRPDEHPLASMLLRFTRILIGIDVADVLIGAGDLVVRRSGDPHTALWFWLAAVAIAIAALVVAAWVRSWLLSWRSARRDRGTLRLKVRR
jgi:hypothetical protein